ncbi:MAG: YtxH-like protein [Armatimonadetes bacterium]|jgi:gas vesicle protein|nr:YtxH-like protein [Armatimonadota bacterium]
MRYLLAMLGGAALGAGAALLLAPQSGSETRSLIKDKTTQCTDGLQEFAHETTMSLRNKMKSFRQDYDEATDDEMVPPPQGALAGMTGAEAGPMGIG